MVGEYTYTCPPGHRAVIRTVDFYSYFLPEGSPPVAFCSAQVDMAGGEAFAFHFDRVPASHWNQWTGQCVLHEGDQVWVGNDLETWTWHVSGAELPIL